MDLNSTAQTWVPSVTTQPTKLTTGNITVWPNSTLPNSWPQTQYIYSTPPQTLCSGDVHVFPCPHCEKCKCGAATVKRKK